MIQSTNDCSTKIRTLTITVLTPIVLTHSIHGAVLGSQYYHTMWYTVHHTCNQDRQMWYITTRCDVWHVTPAIKIVLDALTWLTLQDRWLLAKQSTCTWVISWNSLKNLYPYTPHTYLKYLEHISEKNTMECCDSRPPVLNRAKRLQIGSAGFKVGQLASKWATNFKGQPWLRIRL